MIRRCPSPDPADIISQGARSLGIELTPDAVSKMMRHMGLLLEWGKKVNLTALREPLHMAVLHFLDSVTVFKVLPRGLRLSVMDVGTGAGFPGLILKIVEESFDVTLLDRDPKKIVFLKYVANALDLHGIRFLNTPLQRITENPDPPTFDLLVSRAFASDPALLDSLHILLRPRGMLVRMAGPASLKEAFRFSNFECVNHWEGNLPFSSSFRLVTLYRKINHEMEGVGLRKLAQDSRV
jgi:16S rRNA (guanine527-N7)-methyltransferase